MTKNDIWGINLTVFFLHKRNIYATFAKYNQLINQKIYGIKSRWFIKPYLP